MKPNSHNLATGILTIDLNAIADNYQSIRAYCHTLDEQAQISAVVKADGYGLGMFEVSRALYNAGCRLFYVATPDEGISLRTQHDDIEIFILDGLFIGAEAAYRQHRLIPCLSSKKQILAWYEFDNDLSCVIHFNSGINRLGIELEDFQNIDIDATDRLNIHHIMSHFSSADVPRDAQNALQVMQFEAVSAHMSEHVRSFGNSAGIALEELQNINGKNGNILRPGLALWGDMPFADYPIDLKPVVTLTARVLQLSSLNVGDMVGYVHLFTAQKPMKTAIIAVGYADGLFRQLNSATGDDGYFYFNGYKLPILGKVSMDMIVVDVSDVPDGMIAEGDFVEVIGENISLGMLANWADTISYEILTSLGNRYLRNYSDGES